MTHGSLFSGIGGFDLAADWMWWDNKFHCEWNEFGQKILKHYWPNAKSYGDITKTDFTIWRGKIDVLTGGFPCQPYSQAGKRLGKEDDRHLWPEMLRAIREIKPRWVIGENVYGLVNWSGGLVFHEVQTELEAEGYEVQPYILPACSVNAPHRRDRVWFVAYRKNTGLQISQEFNKRGEYKSYNGAKIRDSIITNGTLRNVTNTERIGQQGHGWAEGQMRTKEKGNWKASWTNSDGRWPTKSGIYIRDDGLSIGLDTTSISEKDWLEESLKGSGNAIVPQVALQLFKTIEQFENKLK